MFKHWSKQTKILLAVFAVVVVIAGGLGVWGVSTGKLKSSASSLGPCDLPGAIVNTYVTNPFGDKMSNVSMSVKDMNGKILASGVTNTSGYVKLCPWVKSSTPIQIKIFGSCKNNSTCTFTVPQSGAPTITMYIKQNMSYRVDAVGSAKPCADR